jgi:hypothetical protein
MPVLLYVLGVLCVLGGAAAVGFGLPVKEFSFGNTLIMAGATGMVGGLIVVGLAAAISQLQRVVEMLGARPLARAGRAMEPFEHPGAVRLGHGPGRVPFPPKPKAESRDHPAEPSARTEPAQDAASDLGAPPSLHNPDVPLMAEEEAEELPLSPRHAAAVEPTQPDMAFPEPEKAEWPEPAPEPEPEPDQPEPPSFEPPWRSPRPSQPTAFDRLWPAEPQMAPEEPSRTPGERSRSRAEAVPRAPGRPDVEIPSDESSQDLPPVAVLKSGVVDGMGYTLYVDGSIEAELPDGTLRFASINELREHLERNS